MRTASVQRGGARASGVGAMLVAAAILAVGCMETQRSLGDECLKNDDCLSGICSSLVCAAAPPLANTTPVADAAGAVETGTAPPDDAGGTGEDGEATDAENDQDAAAESPDAGDDSATDDGGSVD